MKPKRWLAYTVEVNDLLPCYEELVSRFATSDVPLDGAFGSNTTVGNAVPGLLVAIGPAVEPARLAEVLSLLHGLGQQFLILHNDANHAKWIAIGALNLNNEPVVAVSDELRAAIQREGANASELAESLRLASKVHVFGGRAAGSESV